MSYFMQPGSKTYRKDENYFEVDGSRPFSYIDKFEMRDPLKLSDIDGSSPAQIPGYTGTKVASIIAHTKTFTNYGPSLSDINQEWK